MADQAILIAQETAAHDPQPWYLSPHERSRHVLVLGADTQYRQDLLWNMMVQDIRAGAGVAVIDTAGQHADRLLDAIPGERQNDTLYFHLGDAKRTVSFNPFYGVPVADRSRAAQGLMALFVAIWSLSDDSHPLMLRLMRASSRITLALLLGKSFREIS